MADEKHHDEHGEHGGGGHGGGGHGGHGGGGHGGGGHEEHEGAPEWLISFADNVALMMGFFAILLAMNMKPASSGGAEGPPGESAAQQEQVMLDWAISVREAFNNPVNVNSANPNDIQLVRRLLEREGEAQAATPGQRGREHEVRSVRPNDYVGAAGTISFPKNATKLDNAGREALMSALKQFKGMRNVIEVRGHVSASEAYETQDRGMRLSFERAESVAKALIGEGIGWDRIRIIACGDNDRLAAVAYNEAEHQKNQRVELIETDQTFEAHEQEQEDSKSQPTPAGEGHEGASAPAGHNAEGHEMKHEEAPEKAKSAPPAEKDEHAKPH